MKWTKRLASHVTTLALDQSEVYTFDLEGRPVSWWDGERVFKRSLASSVHVRSRDSQGRSHSTATETEAAAAFDRVLERARQARAGVTDGADDPRTTILRLDRIVGWTPERLRPVFAAAREAFPGRSLAGFLDVYTRERKPADAWVELRTLGQETVHLGIESGHEPLLAWMSKPAAFEATLLREFLY